MIEYRFQTDKVDLKKVCDLYKTTGWWDEPCNTEQVSRLISGSFCFITAWDNDNIMGMGRVISDSFSDAYIQDVFVEEKYRKQGIANNIVSRLMNYCKEKNIHWIALIAAPGSTGVYEKLGFEKMGEHTPMLFKKKAIGFEI